MIMNTRSCMFPSIFSEAVTSALVHKDIAACHINMLMYVLYNTLQEPGLPRLYQECSKRRKFAINSSTTYRYIVIVNGLF